jgi:hypothetical protein
LAETGAAVHLIGLGPLDDLPAQERISVGLANGPGAVVRLMGALVHLQFKHRYSRAVLHGFQSLVALPFLRRATRTIYFAHEFYPLAEVTLKQRPAKIVERLLRKRIDSLVVPSRQRLRLHRLELARRASVRDYILLNTPYNINSGDAGTRRWDLVYAGRLHADLGLAELAKAVARGRVQARSIDLIGPIQPGFEVELERLLRAHRCLNYIGSVPYESLPERLAQYRLGFVWYPPKNLNWRYCAPAKLFEYLAAGLLVVAGPSPGFGAWARRFPAVIEAASFDADGLEAALLECEQRAKAYAPAQIAGFLHGLSFRDQLQATGLFAT